MVNPDGARMQIEGCITMGLGYALAEELRFDGGEILDRNFDTYEMPALLLGAEDRDGAREERRARARRAAASRRSSRSAPSIANAVFDATGARLYRLPMTPERVKAALAGKGE